MGVMKIHRMRYQVEALKAVFVCNCCGKRVVQEEPSEYRATDMFEFSAEGGFEDTFPGDLTRISFVLCTDCLKSLVTSFKVPVDEIHLMGRNPIEVVHSETGETLIFEGVWVHKPGATPPPPGEGWSWDEEGSELFPAEAIYQHFKGNLYRVIDHARDLETREPMVIYVGLHGESKVYARPARMWYEQVDRDGYSGPRFQVKYVYDGAPMHNRFKEPE